MKWICCLLLSYVFFSKCLGQSIDMQLISPIGGTGQNGQLEWSVGEVGIYGNERLTQGFHQGNFLITNIYNAYLPDSPIPYPNPTIYGIQMTNLSKNCWYQLYDSSGKSIKTGWINGPNDFVDMRAFVAGIYYIKIFTDERNSTIYKVEKIK